VPQNDWVREKIGPEVLWIFTTHPSYVVIYALPETAMIVLIGCQPKIPALTSPH